MKFRSVVLWYLALGFVAFSAAVPASSVNSDLERARDQQDSAGLDRLIAQSQQAAQAKQNAADAQYRVALAYSYGAEVAIEVKDKKKAQSLAEAGMDAAKRAIAINGNSAEYHRVLGELCGQVIPANPLFALKYGQCARDEVDKAIQLDGKLALAYVSRGVGNYYLPPSFGGGPDVALKDLDKAIELDPKLADAYLWKGVALRKANRLPEARQALQHAVQLAPNRLWAKQQLEKLPAQ
jgi:tetratricopeptide (TPR) repeat protein